MRKAFVYLITASLVFFAGLSNTYCENEKTEELFKTKVASVGDEIITFGELEKAFKKNMNRNGAEICDVPKDSIMDFLDLYLKYRLKVNDAIDRGYENDSAVVAE